MFFPPSCLILCDPRLHGILQARILKWVTFPFSRGYLPPRDWTQVSCLCLCILKESQQRPENRILWEGSPLNPSPTCNGIRLVPSAEGTEKLLLHPNSHPFHLMTGLMFSGSKITASSWRILWGKIIFSLPPNEVFVFVYFLLFLASFFKWDKSFISKSENIDGKICKHSEDNHSTLPMIPQCLKKRIRSCWSCYFFSFSI